jgi:hypothetical protein
VFNYGEIGDEFFIILKGVISINVPFGRSKIEANEIWMKFRDISIDEYGERDQKEIILNKKVDES